MTEKQPDALRLADWCVLHSSGVSHPAIDVAAELCSLYERNVALEAQVIELDRLCDATYVQQGADAYHHACDEIERFQEKRRKAKKEVGTTHSLCDGMAWVYGKLDELEAQLEAVGAGKAKGFESLGSEFEKVLTENLWDLYTTDDTQPAQRLQQSGAMAGVLFDFMGMLTSQDEVTTFSAKHEAGPAVEQIKKFAAKRGLCLDGADVKGWQNPLQQSEPVRVPLSEEQLTKMWRGSAFRGSGGQIDWFIEGFREAERTHCITSKAEGAQP